MLRDIIRGAIMMLTLALSVASAGTVLCEMDCAAGEQAASAAPSELANDAAMPSCHNIPGDAAQNDLPAPHKNSDGNSNRGGHAHARILATIGGRVVVSPATRISAVSPVAAVVALAAHSTELSRKNNSPPIINSAAAFATGVLRI